MSRLAPSQAQEELANSVPAKASASRDIPSNDEMDFSDTLLANSTKMGFFVCVQMILHNLPLSLLAKGELEGVEA